MIVSDPFDTIDAKDGFHVVQTEGDDRVSLSVIAYGGGELLVPESGTPDDASIEIVEYERPTREQKGSVVRLELVLDAIARYLTTGGQWGELESAARKMRKKAIGGLVFPGYHLVDSYSTKDGATYQHIFAKDDQSGDAVLWEEPCYNAAGGIVGGFVHRTTLAQILQEQEDDGWRETSTEEAGEDSASVQLRSDADPFPSLGPADGDSN